MINSFKAITARLITPCLLISSFATAEDEEILPDIVVTATLTEQPLTKIGSAITVLDNEELEKRGIRTLQEALNESPGIFSTSTSGQRGAIGSIFARGLPTDFSQFIVDGIRINESSIQANSFLGSSSLHGLSNIEILRGPQSALYGSNAAGSVISLHSARGQGAPSTRLFQEYGSFDSSTSTLSTQGEYGKFAYNIGLGYETTNNDTDANGFEQFSYAGRFDYEVNEQLELGLTFRGKDNRYETPGSFPSVDRLDSYLITLFANAKLTDWWDLRATTGFYSEAFDSASGFSFGTDSELFQFSLNNEFRIIDSLTLTAGASYSHIDFENSFAVSENRDRIAGHLGLQWEITDALTWYAAGRVEDYDEFGTEETFRTTLSYNIEKTGTLLRVSYGTAYIIPTFTDLFGSSFGVGNPELTAEDSEGWDIGVDQKIGANHLLSASFFRNRVRNAINAPFFGTPTNESNNSATNGIEIGLQGNFFDEQLNYKIAYTYLNDDGNNASNFLPRNTLNGSVDYQITEKLSAGIGLSYVSESTFGGIETDTRFLQRLYANYKLTDNINLHARIENLSDEDYELANFGGPIQGAGRGFYGGISFEW